MTRKLLMIAFAAFALAASGCGSSSSSSGSTPSGSVAPDPCAINNLTTLTAGTLTIGTDNPAYSPYFTGGSGHEWKGQYNNDPYTGKGFEDAVAYAVAEKMGFTQQQVKWAVTHFNQSYAPGPKNFDFYLAQVSYSAHRATAVDFSDSYYDVNQSVVALKSNPISKAASLADLKQYKLGTQIGTTSYDYITQTIQPSQQPQAYNTLNDAIHALQAKQIDGIVIDLPTAFYMTAVQIPDSTVVGQFPAVSGGEHYGLVLDKGSSLTPCVNKALAALKADGTLTALTKTWLSDKVSAPILQ
ncbi:MAG: polar amino acid transport system substrate-binding protein [Gaiellales bacterium]|jgi:polar amino acid transport system substrate-binding protein|nr:polar amino acid transport system substrate-binding protein [Gaiellales bacterium]